MLKGLIHRYRQKGIMVDSNLLVAYLVGLLDPAQLGNCRATKALSPDDFGLLEKFLGQFNRVITTPHILAEVSNLAGRLPESLHVKFRLVFRHVIERLSEKYDTSASISQRAEFLRFGLADTAISMAKPGSYLVLTDELALAGLLQKQGKDVVNFNHLRVEMWRQN